MALIEQKIQDGHGNVLHENDRVFVYDYFNSSNRITGVKRVYGTLVKSDHPKTFGRWCIDYDDGESFVVLDFKGVWRADKA